MRRADAIPPRANRRALAWLVFLAAAYLAITLAPIALAARQGVMPRPFLSELSSALAMTCFAILLVEFVLSGRFRAVSAPIGIDLTMRFHQVLGRIALAFVLIHPVLYYLPAGDVPRWQSAGGYATRLSAEAMITGLAAWTLLAALVVFAIFRDQLPHRYEAWRIAHGVSAALIAAMSLHHTLDIGRYAQDPALAVFWIAGTAIALATLAFVYFVAPVLQARRPYVVAGVRHAAERTWALAIEPLRGEALRFRAGQFVWLKVGRALLRVADHPFSISSSPGARPRIEFLIKEAGDFTRDVANLAPGRRVFLDGPHGNFTLEGRHGTGIVLIAGGIGIAPVLSILRALAERADPRPVVLVYGNRISGQIVGAEELEALRARIDLTVIHILSEPPPGWTGAVGELKGAPLRAALPAQQRGEWLYFVCGPTPMIDAVESELIELGVPLAQIVSERFRYESGRTSLRERLIVGGFVVLVVVHLAAATAFALR
jgi:predicted ferric reductase